MNNTIRILQCNTDNLRYGVEYITKLLPKADLLFLQRFPKEYKEQLTEASGHRVFMLESCPKGNLCLAIAKTTGLITFIDTEAIVLPSHDAVLESKDEWQGCTALRTVINGVNFINFLPAYELKNENGECAISDFYRKSDIDFLLKKFKDEPTVIIGDFHVKPNADSTNALLQKFEFTSFIDDAKSFKPCKDKETFNLDKCISNIDITVDNVEVYDTVYTERGHYAISYNLHMPKLDK
jgi:hypothetical protein